MPRLISEILNNPRAHYNSDAEEGDEEDEVVEVPYNVDDVLSNISEKAKTKIVQDTMQQLFKHEMNRLGLKAFCAEWFPKADQSYIEKFNDIQERKDFGSRISPKDTIGLFITISPPPDSISASDLLELAKKKYLKVSQMFTESVFVIEQSGSKDEDKGYHPHLHILLRLNKSSPSGERGKALKQIEGHWKKFSSYKHALDVKPVSSKTWPKKIMYLQGSKDKEKVKQVEMDKVWREENNFLQIYQFPKF